MSPPSPITKICGLSHEHELAAAVRGGASHVGFVHYPPSVRHLALPRIAELIAAAPPALGTAIVLVNPDDALVDRVAALGPDVLQLHRVGPDRLAAVRARWRGELWQGVAVRDAADLDRLAREGTPADRLLLDAPTDADEVPGGTGRAFDWGLLRDTAPGTSWILSGGLTPANVARARSITGAVSVDVSSGVESAPGVKDVDLIAAFLTACRP